MSLGSHLHTPSALHGHPLGTPSSLVVNNVSTLGHVTISFIFPPPKQGVKQTTVPQSIPPSPGGHVTAGGPLSCVD